MEINGKVWGITQNIFFKNNVQIDRIEIKKGGYCSTHLHKHKYNMFFVESGEVDIEIWKNDYDLIDKTTLTSQQYTTVKPDEYHKFLAIQDSVIYEIYWVELSKEDIIRKNVGGLKNYG